MFLDVQHPPLHGLPRLLRVRRDICILLRPTALPSASPLLPDPSHVFLFHRLVRVRIISDGKRGKRTRTEHAVPFPDLKQGVYQRTNITGRRDLVVFRRTTVEIEEGCVVAKRARVSRSMGAFGIDER